MAEIIQCPLCQRQLQIDEGSWGQWFKCPSCAGTFRIAPANQAPAVPAAPAPPRSRPTPVQPKKGWDEPPPLVPRVPPPPRREPVIHEEFNIKKVESQLPVNPHRGILILAMGFIGLALFACSPVGWILGGLAMSMGNEDLQRMQRGSMDRGGEVMTFVGRICGMIAVVLATLAVFGYFVMFFMKTLGR